MNACYRAQALQLDVARAAFIRLRDVRAVELANRLAAGLAAGTQQGLLLAEVAAWQGRFAEAARLFVGGGQLSKVRGALREHTHVLAGRPQLCDGSCVRVCVACQPCLSSAGASADCCHACLHVCAPPRRRWRC